jgi:hypothetical protein
MVSLFVSFLREVPLDWRSKEVSLAGFSLDLAGLHLIDGRTEGAGKSIPSIDHFCFK